MLGGALAGNIVLPSETQFFRRRWNFDLVASSGGGDNGIGRSRNGKKLSLSFVTGGYRRIPMDTAGAYQLIDDDTGDRVIVWGGADTDSPDSPLPFKETLSWKPYPQGQGQPKPREGGGVVVEPKPHAGRRSFNRLKAPKVKALITKSSNITSKGSVTDNRKSIVSFDDTVADSTNTQPPFTSNSRFTRLLEHEKLVDDMVTDEKVQGTHSVHIRAGQRVEAAQGHRSGSKVVASRGWSNAAAPVYDTSYSQLTQPRKMSTDHGFFSRKSFKVLGASDDIIKSLRNQCVLRPSHIQALAYGPVLEGKSCIIADQSGSGKTLAYLAPLIQRLSQEELEGLSKSSSKSPRVVVLVPTTELASQVLNNCRTISKNGVAFRSMVATGGFRQKTQLDNLQLEMDVLIATPGRFIFLLQEGFVQLSNLRCVVLDEVDILFNDEGFEQVLQSLISYAPMDSQYLFVTATLPVDIYNKLVEVFPDCEVTMGPGIHRTSSRLEEVLVDCSGDQEEKSPDTAFLNKKSALLQLVEESPVPKTIVFCNKIETCRKVENILKRFDRIGHNVKVLPFHAALEQETRLANMKDFLNSQSKYSMFLVCTDRASRGIDFPNVNHVVLFDFPRDPSEYVRRVGRTARGAGGKGKAFAFVVGKQVSLARRVMERNKKGHPLHGVPCAYEL